MAVCNLASVNLSAFVVEEPGQKPSYDLQKLYEITKVGGWMGSPVFVFCLTEL